MKRLIKKIVLYRCSICKTDYKNKHDAQKCELRTLENKEFSTGDMVSNREARTCGIHNKNYFFRGRVVKIVGPMPSDYEYETKWLGGKSARLNSHVFQYHIKFQCPHCKETREALYFAPELNKISR